MDGDVVELPLPAVLDQKAAYALADSLLAARGHPVRLNGAAVQRLGGQSLQVLLAGRHAWAADGQGFVIAEGSEALTDGLALLGASALFSYETAPHDPGSGA
jgi:anti-anti-sigma regulatory factor